MKLKFVPAGRDHGWYFEDGRRVVMAQGQPVPLDVAQEIAGSLAAGWMPWPGGDDMPTEAVGQRIDIELRNGEIWQNQQSETVGNWLSWAHQQLDGDIINWRVTPLPYSPWDDDELIDANGWHDIPELQMAGQRQVIEWPDESRADRDPTAIMGGIVLAPVEQPEPPTLTVAVSAPAQPANARRRIIDRVMNAILLGQASALAGQALFSIGKGWPVMAVAATATAMWAIHAATR